MTADRPATEPRTDPDDILLALVNRLNKSPARVDEHFPDVLRTIADLRAEAAQGAAPPCPECEGKDGWHADWCHMSEKPVVTPWMVGQASPVHLTSEQLSEFASGLNGLLSEGAAPRAEGLDAERLRRALATVYHWAMPEDEEDDAEEVLRVNQIAAEYTRLSRPSDERVGEETP